MTKTNFSGPSGSPENPPVAMLLAESLTTFKGLFGDQAAGGKSPNEQ